MTTTASNPNVALWNKKKKKKKYQQHINSQHHIPASNSPFPLSSLFFRAPFWRSFFFDFVFLFLLFLHKGKTNHIPVKGEIPALPDVVFPAFPPSLQSLPSFDRFSTHTHTHKPSVSSPSFFFLALWNWSVHQEKKGNECTLDSALNRLTHFIDDADDTLLMILIKIGSWQADMFQYESGYCGVFKSTHHVTICRWSPNDASISCRTIVVSWRTE